MEANNQDRWSAWQRFLPAISLIVAIFILSHQEKPPTIGNDPELSAIAGHLVAYGLLGGALFLAFSRLRSVRHAALLAIACAGIYGVIDEFHQSFVPGRHTDPRDLLVDLIGASLAVIALVLLSPVSTRRGQGAATQRDKLANVPPANDL